ncbi:MAG: hypothetical protein NTV51_10010 [Verrucomicrobia bacterium]|nr:hypothetical protein [Verrucomicrobiota bacterium]
MAPVVSAPRAPARPWLAAACLVAVVVLAYANTLRAPFLFDDAGAVLDNPTIRRLGSLSIFRPPTDGSTTTGRPVVNVSFALNYALGGEDVLGYHAVNLAIHALAALTLFGLLRRTPPFATGAGAPWPAFFAALLWALHPLQTESVTCIAQRTESLCGLFYLLTLYGFVRAAGAPAPEEPAGALRRTPWLALSLVSCRFSCCCTTGPLSQAVLPPRGANVAPTMRCSRRRGSSSSFSCLAARVRGVRPPDSASASRGGRTS